MQSFKCTIPPIEYGFGRLSEIGNHVKKIASRAFLAIDPYCYEIGLGKKVERLLAQQGVECVSFHEIEPNPSCFSVDSAALLSKKHKSECVVGLGGGSAIDFGKAVAIMTAHEGQCWDYTDRKDHEIRIATVRTLPIIAIPTTAGTGAEVTPYAVFNNPTLGEKSSIVSAQIMPKLALVDPELTITMGPRLTALSGIDALAHALEGYISTRANAFSKMVSRESMSLISRYLPLAVENGQNRTARESMAWASTLGGIVVGHVGGVLPHALGQPVSGHTGAPHGASIAATFIEIIRLSFQSNPNAFADITEIFDPQQRDLAADEKAAMSAVVLEKFFKKIGVAEKLGKYGLKKEDIPKVTNMAFTCYSGAIQRHPRKFTREEIMSIYEHSI